MRRQDHGRDDYHDYFNNLADQYLVWPTITLGVHIYTWILSMIYGIYMDSTERKEECLRREIFYVTWPAKLRKELS